MDKNFGVRNIFLNDYKCSFVHLVLPTSFQNCAHTVQVKWYSRYCQTHESRTVLPSLNTNCEIRWMSGNVKILRWEELSRNYSTGWVSHFLVPGPAGPHDGDELTVWRVDRVLMIHSKQSNSLVLVSLKWLGLLPSDVLTISCLILGTVRIRKALAYVWWSHREKDKEGIGSPGLRTGLSLKLEARDLVLSRVKSNQNNLLILAQSLNMEHADTSGRL